MLYSLLMVIDTNKGTNGTMEKAMANTVLATLSNDNTVVGRNMQDARDARHCIEIAHRERTALEVQSTDLRDSAFSLAGRLLSNGDSDWATALLEVASRDKADRCDEFTLNYINA